MVVYGHTPVPEADWLNRTINIDTGCVFGGKLTALRYPERSSSRSRPRDVYCEPARPLPRRQQAAGARPSSSTTTCSTSRTSSASGSSTTRLQRNVTVREENAIAGAGGDEPLRRRPAWLIYLPPTMSPCETSSEPGLLEHPDEAFAYFRDEGVAQVVCEEKHMGSRAVVVVCRDEAAAADALRRDHRAKAGVVLSPAPAGGSSTIAARRRQFLDRVRRRSTRPGSGTSSAPTGSAWTAS